MFHCLIREVNIKKVWYQNIEIFRLIICQKNNKMIECFSHKFFFFFHKTNIIKIKGGKMTVLITGNTVILEESDLLKMFPEEKVVVLGELSQSKLSGTSILSKASVQLSKIRRHKSNKSLLKI